MPVDQLINTKRLRELVPDLLTPEGTDALATLFREILKSFMWAERDTDDINNGDYALQILKLAEAELQVLARHLSRASVEEEGEEDTPLDPHDQILAAYRRELAGSLASLLDEVWGDLQGMLDPPLLALLTWSQARQEIGPSFRTRWPRPFVSPASVESARQEPETVAGIAREVDKLTSSLDAQARRLGSIADRLPEPTAAIQALLENDQEAAFRDHPLEALKWSLKYLEGETEGLLKHFRRERAKFPLPVEKETS